MRARVARRSRHFRVSTLNTRTSLRRIHRAKFDARGPRTSKWGSNGPLASSPTNPNREENMFKAAASSLAKVGLLSCLCSAFLTAQNAHAQSAGDIAIIGWIDNGSPDDSLAFVTLAPINA